MILLFVLLTSRIEAQSTIEKIGDYGLYSLPLLAVGSTFIHKDKAGFFMLSKSALLNIGVTLALKGIINKERPNGEDAKSFPSGHTSVTFQSASFLQKRYGWQYGIPAYVIASYTGFSRVHAKKHFVEDVAAGALLGIVSSYIFTSKIEELTFHLTKDNNQYMCSFNYKF